MLCLPAAAPWAPPLRPAASLWQPAASAGAALPGACPPWAASALVAILSSASVGPAGLPRCAAAAGCLSERLLPFFEAPLAFSARLARSRTVVWPSRKVHCRRCSIWAGVSTPCSHTATLQTSLELLVSMPCHNGTHYDRPLPSWRATCFIL